MTRYTVTYTSIAENDLTREWLNAPDRIAVNQAAYQIDRELKSDASQKGTEVREGLRQLVVPPLKVQFTVEEDDRTVTIWSVRHVGELTNGR